MKKLIKDGMTAVLVSPGYGAGWSTWLYSYPDCLFDGELAQMILDKEDDETLLKYCQKTYVDGYFGGLYDLEVVWLPVGTKFAIREHDGYESIEILEEVNWKEA